MQLCGGEASRDCPVLWRQRCASASPWALAPHLVTTATITHMGVWGKRRSKKPVTVFCRQISQHFLLKWISIPPLYSCWTVWPQRRANRPHVKTSLCDDGECFSSVMSSLPCSIAARTLRFSSVAAVKLMARSRGRTGESTVFASLFGCFFGGVLRGLMVFWMWPPYLAADFRKASWQESWILSWKM